MAMSSSQTLAWPRSSPDTLSHFQTEVVAVQEEAREMLASRESRCIVVFMVQMMMM
jgi:hypothetical protein